MPLFHSFFSSFLLFSSSFHLESGDKVPLVDRHVDLGGGLDLGGGDGGDGGGGGGDLVGAALDSRVDTGKLSVNVRIKLS